MKLKTSRGKCPRCCPDGRACFTVYSETRRCNNCHLELPRRKVAPSGKPTRSQERVLARLRELGWTTEVRMIGRKVWVSGSHAGRAARGAGFAMVFGDTYYGTVSVNGAFSLNLQRLGGCDPVTDEIGLDVYFRNSV